MGSYLGGQPSSQAAQAGVSVDERQTQPDIVQRFAKQWIQIATALGAMIGTLLAAAMGEAFGRQITYFAMCVLSMASVLWLYQFHQAFGLPLLMAALVASIFTAPFYGWLPLYLPELFPTRMRSTCQGFTFNFGRILAVFSTLQMSSLLPYFKRASLPMRDLTAATQSPVVR